MIEENNKKKAVVAMSGGVDSSVAAALLKEQGYDCVGVSMQLWDYSKAEDSAGSSEGSCCSLEDLADARRIADKLEIPYYVMNMEEAFSREVVDYFVESYLTGETPNPCTKCNQELKFSLLLAKAKALGAEFVATGHYARIDREGARPRLLKGLDPNKDQSYFLFTMSSAELTHTLFPLGELTKDEVREHARSLGLKTAEKPESQEICFVINEDYGDFIDSYSGSYSGHQNKSIATLAKDGDMIDSRGNRVGRHRGLWRYTVGQRKGLGIGGEGGPYYVLAIDVEKNKLVVGTESELYSNGLTAREVNWIGPKPEAPVAAVAKIRYRDPGGACMVTPLDDDRVSVEFDEPARAVAPGQAVVFYDGDEVLGGGWIEGATSR